MTQAATATWVHRGNGAELWLELEPSAGFEPATTILLQPPAAETPPMEWPLARRSSGAGAFHHARVDLADALSRAPQAGEWRFLLGPGTTLDAPEGEHARMVVESGSGAYTIAAVGGEHGLALEVAAAAPWAEVELIAGEDAGIRIEGRVVGRRTDGESWQLGLRSADDGAEQWTDVPVRDQRFVAALREVPAGAQSLNVLLRCREGPHPALRLGRHLDDVARKDQALIYAWHTLSRPSGPLAVQPAYTRYNNLYLRVRPGAAPTVRVETPSGGARRRREGKHGGGGRNRKRTLRRRLRRRARRLRRSVGRRAYASLGAAFGIVAVAARISRRLGRHRPSPDDPVYLLLGNAYGMGGTIRTVWNVAGGLAQHQPVHLLSVIRHADEPFFGADPNVRLRHLVDRRPRPDGAGGVRRRLLDALDRRPSVVYPKADGRYDSFSLLSDIQILRALWRVPAGIFMGTRPGLNVITARFAPGRLTIVGQDHLALSAYRPELRAELLRVYPALDALAVLTQADEKDYAEALQGARPLVRHIPNAVPDVPFPRSDLSAKHVVAGGRLAPGKRFDLLVTAFARVVDERPDWSLRIYGAGRTRARIQKTVLQHDLSEHVLLMGATDRLAQEMAKASIFALSSRFEGFGMVLIEAFSCGLPAVSFACPLGPREIVKHEVNGLLVPELDVQALAEGLLRMIKDEELRRRCAAGALESAAEFSMPQVTRRWRELFADLGGWDAPRTTPAR